MNEEKMHGWQNAYRNTSAGIALRQRMRILVKVIDGRQTQNNNICGSTTDKRMDDGLVCSHRVME